MQRSILLSLLAVTTLAAAPRGQTFEHDIPDLPPLRIAMDVAVDSNGDIWVASWQNDQLVKLSPTGDELLRVGREFRSGASGPTVLTSTHCVAAGPYGDVYVGIAQYVARFDTNGRFLSWFGGTGSGPGEFGRAGSIATAPNGDVFVVDKPYHRVQRFDRHGVFLSEFGSQGTAPGEFDFAAAGSYLVGIEVDSNGNVWVVDDGNARVQTLTATGTPLASHAIPAFTAGAFAQTGITVDMAGRFYVSRRGGGGPALQALDANGALLWEEASGGVGGVTLDPSGDLLVADSSLNTIRKLDAGGTLLATFGNPGMSAATAVDGRFGGARGVAFDAAGDLWAADVNTPRLQRFDSSGAFAGKITQAFSGIWGRLATDAAGNLYASTSGAIRKYSPGGALLATIPVPGSFSDLAIDSTGAIYISLSNDHEVVKLDAAGSVIHTIGGTQGSGPGEFDVPAGLGIAPNDDLLVCDNRNHRIQRFDSTGAYLGEIVRGPGVSFSFPQDVAVDANGCIHLASYGSRRLSVFTSSGALILQFGASGGGDGEVAIPIGLAVANGRLAVADSFNNRVTVFDVSLLDDQIPTVTITSPADYGVVTSPTITLTGTVADTNPTTVTSTPYGVFAQLPQGGGAVSGTVEVSGAPDGVRSLALSATDTSGNTAGTSILVALDRAAPTLTVSSPLEGAHLGTPTATLSLSAADLTATTVTVSHGGGTWAVPDPDNSGFWFSGSHTPTISLVEGPNAIVVEAVDAAGWTTTITRNVIADFSAPIVTITQPAAGDCFGPGDSPITVIAHIDDLCATTITSTQGCVDGSLGAGGGIRTGTLALHEGENAITVRATDPFGRFGETTVSVVLDTTPPLISFDAPDDGDLLRGAIDAAVSADDPLPGSGVASVALAVDGTLIGTDAGAPFELGVDTSSFGDGGHVLTATAIDGKGNTSLASISFTSDNTDPTLVITSPASRAVVSGGALAFVADASDAFGLSEITMQVAGVAPSTDGSLVFGSPQPSALATSTEDTTRWPDGELLLTVSAFDAAGNEQTAQTTVIVDNTAPDKTLIAPLDGAQVTGTVPIVAEASDPNLQSLAIYVDGVLVGSTVATSLTVAYDTTGRAEGSMTIEVVVTDAAGNRSSCLATVEVVNFTYEFAPHALNLGSRGRGVVTAHVEGPTVGSLLPITAHVVELRVDGGNPVFAQSAGGVDDEDGDQVPDLTIRFDRRALIASIQAGIMAGTLPATGEVDVELWIDGALIGTSSTRIVGGAR